MLSSKNKQGLPKDLVFPKIVNLKSPDIKFLIFLTSRLHFKTFKRLHFGINGFANLDKYCQRTMLARKTAKMHQRTNFF